MTTYEIQARGQDGQWSAEYCGQDHTTFPTREEAEAAIRSLKALGGDFAHENYRIVERD